MTDSMVGRVPAMKAVWKEQLRVVGLAIRREGALAAAALVLGSIAFVAVIRIPALRRLAEAEGAMGELVLDPGSGDPPWSLFAVFVALILPLGVWKGERRFGDTPLWSLPVDHRRHALTKVAAGWIWLLAILGSAFVWVTLTVLASGGTLGVDEVRLLIVDPVGARAGTAGATDPMSWTTPWWEWVLPFTAATAAYLLASTLLLATPRPLFWAVGLWVVVLAVVGVAEFWDVGWIHRGTDLVSWYIGGDPFTRGVQLPTGRREAWMLLPSLKMWAASSAFWISLGVVGVLGASARPRDH